MTRIIYDAREGHAASCYHVTEFSRLVSREHDGAPVLVLIEGAPGAKLTRTEVRASEGRLDLPLS